MPAYAPRDRNKGPSAEGKGRQGNPAKDAVSTALSLLAPRSRSVKEVAERLKIKGFGPDQVSKAIDYLVSGAVLDDLRFAAELAGSRIRNKNWGIERVALELRSKGVPDGIIRTALSSIDPSTDTATATAALAKWMRKTGLTFPLEKKELERALRHLSARGFSAEVASSVLKKQR